MSISRLLSLCRRCEERRQQRCRPEKCSDLHREERPAGGKESANRSCGTELGVSKQKMHGGLIHAQHAQTLSLLPRSMAAEAHLAKRHYFHEAPCKTVLCQVRLLQ